jgi:hypothetical protein
MADDTLRMRAQVVDEFSSPLRKLKSELASVKPPADLARIRDGLKGLEQHSLAAGQAIRNGVGAALSGIGISAIGVTAAIGGAAAALKNFATGTAELRHFSVEIGLSVNRLRELQALGQRFGVDENSMLGGLKKFSNELFDIRRRRGAAYEELLKAGPGGAELAERLVGSKSVEEAVGRALGFLERIPNAVQRQRLAETLFGNGMFGRLGEGGPGSIARLMEEIGKAIGKTTGEGVEAARKFEEQFARLRETIQGVGNELGVKLLPVLTDKMRELGASLKDVDWKGFADNAEFALRGTMEIVKAVAEVVKGIGQILRHDFSPIIGEKGYKGALGSPLMVGRPEAGTPGYKARVEYLEEKRAELEKRVETYRQKGDKASEIGAQSKLDQIVEELRKLREGAERGATVQQQSFGGGAGYAGLIHNASLGGGFSGGSFLRGAPMYRPPASMMPERNAPMIGGGAGGAVSPGGGADSPVGKFKGSTFSTKAPGVMRQLMADFGLTREQAAGILGNLGHESAGFRQMQEQRPMIPGSRGGWGWAQWTGPRRRAFEKWVAERGLDPKSDEANYGFLRHELQTSQRGALAAVKRQSSAMGAMQAFELEFERSGVKAWGSRQKWTQRALDAFKADPKAVAGASPASNGGARIGDELMRKNFPAQKVEGSASLRIELDGFPRGTKATPDASGMFKKIELDRGRQMSGIDV